MRNEQQIQNVREEGLLNVEEETRREAETVWLSGMVDPTVTVRERVSRTWNVTLMDVQTSPHGQSGVHVPRHVVEE